MNRQTINLELLIQKYSPMVYRRCVQLLKDEETAKDTVQDIFLKVFENQGSLNLKTPSSLLWTMATNLCLNHIRDNKRFASDSDEILIQIASLKDEEAESLNKMFLNKLFKTQKVDTRTIAYLHFVDGFTLEETAKEVGLSVSGVRKRLRNLKVDFQKVVNSWNQIKIQSRI